MKHNTASQNGCYYGINLSGKELTMKRKYLVIVSVAIICLLFVVSVIVGGSGQQMSIAIEKENLQYVAVNTGAGSKILEYEEHREMIDSLIAMLDGEYTYRKTWSNAGKSGGGPYLIEFCYTEKEDKYDVRYVDGYIAVAKNNKGKYRLYEKSGEQLSFDELEEYLVEHGEFLNFEFKR